MQNQSNSLPFSEQDIKRVLGSDEGKQLLRLLNRDGGAALRQAAEAIKAGDAARAKQLLSPIMETSEAASLVEKINQKR